MALTIKGPIAFGIGNSGIPVAGASNVTSAEQTDEATTNVVAKDSGGNVIAQAVGNVKKSVRIEGYGKTKPAVGSDITVNGTSAMVMSSGVSASNEDFVKYNASAEGYVSLDGIPVITSETAVAGVVGTALSYATAASGTPTSYAAVGLPGGLTINASTGAVSGSPTTSGVYYAFLSATNAAGTGSTTVTFTITAA